MNKQTVAIFIASFFMLMTLAGCQEAPEKVISQKIKVML